MGPRKQILAAAIVQDIQFRSMDDRNNYLKQLDARKINHQLVDTFERDDGSVIIRISKQYNGSDLIEL